jgi:hypothetical protein
VWRYLVKKARVNKAENNVSLIEVDFHLAIKGVKFDGNRSSINFSPRSSK